MSQKSKNVKLNIECLLSLLELPFLCYSRVINVGLSITNIEHRSNWSTSMVFLVKLVSEGNLYGYAI